MAHPEQLDCKPIGRRQCVAGHSGDVVTCTCSGCAVSQIVVVQYNEHNGAHARRIITCAAR